MWAQYTWVFGLSFIVAFGCAFGIGANDVANSFGTSVGAKAITIFQAVCIAAVCEFLGAVLLGASVTDTIKSGIAQTKYFTATPELLMFLMFCVMTTCCFWDNFACHMEMPVSTTHTTVGSVVGGSIAIRGFKAVVWYSKKSTFPYVGGMTAIFLSWVFSPILAAAAVVLLYGIILRPFVLRSQHSFQRSFFVVPVLVGITIFVICYFIIQTGNKNKTWSTVSDERAVWISIIPAVVGGIFTLAVGMPLIRRRVLAEDEAREKQVESEAVAKGLELGEGEQAAAAQPGKVGTWWEKQKANSKVVNALANNPLTKVVSYGATYNVHQCTEEGSADYDEATANMWARAEAFEPRTESLFRYLQVFSACVMSLAHGSNDVANATGPFAAVYGIWSTQSLTSKSNVPEWILVIGGAGIVCGLALYGYKIMRVIGVKSAKLSNTRGFCCELSTAIVIMIASRYGLPVSTTQTIMGAVWMMGLFEGIRGLNYKTLARTWLGWVLTLVVASFLCAGLTSLLLYSPQKTASDDLVAITRMLGTNSLNMVRQVNQTGTANLPNLKAINDTFRPAYYRAPVVQSRIINSFNSVLRLYNNTFAVPALAAQG